MQKIHSFFRTFPCEYQLDAMDCGPACLQSIAKFYGKNYTLKTIRELSYITREGVSLLSISKAAEKIGFRTRGVKVNIKNLISQAKLPCILHWRQEHFVVLYKIKKKSNQFYFYIADPSAGKIKLDFKSFINAWLQDSEKDEEIGICLLLEPSPSFGSLKDQAKPTYRFRFIFKYLTPFKGYYLQLIIAVFLAGLLQLCFPFITQAIVDKGILFKDLNLIYLLLIGFLFFSITNATVNYIRSLLLLHISSRINISILSDFLIKLMHLPISFFDKKFTGDLLQRIKDHERIETFLVSESINIVYNLISISIFSIILLLFNYTIFLIYMLCAFLYIFWVFIFLKQRKLIDYKKFIISAQNQSNIYQIINGIQDIKLNNCETEKRWSWESIQIRLFKISLSGVKIEQIQNIRGTLINDIKNIFIIFHAAILTMNGEISIGSMLAIQYINGQLNVPLGYIVHFIHSLQDAKISLERLNEIHLENEEEENSKNKKIIKHPADILCSKISFKYNDPYSNPILNNLSFTIPKGKITAIVGFSGAGKTTLIKLLLGFYSPETGSILIGNTNLKDIDISTWREHCGSVMQDGFIFNDTIANNICIKPGNIDKQRLIFATKCANIYDFIISLPLKFNTKIGEEGNGLSQGQKQRILIARAIYKNPDYLFFDEATNALDADNENNIIKNITENLKGKTIVIIAHRLSSIKKADQIILLRDGTIAESGSHDYLLKKRGFYYNLILKQL